jgi:glycosyltransferase involved in cell wall biosynthesis
MSELKPVSVLMPICNEADVIRHVVEEWQTSVFSRLPAGSELVLDDCSEDGTFEILQELRREFPFIRVNRSARDGFFNSAIRLYRLAKNELIFFTDSDGQYVPADFWRIYERIDECEMVHGYKSGRCDPFYRKAGSLLFNAVSRAYFNSRAKDVNSAFRLVRRESLDAVLDSIRHLRMMPNAELYLRLERQGHRISNVPVRHRARTNGPSRSIPLFKFFREGFFALVGLRRLKRDLALANQAAFSRR